MGLLCLKGAINVYSKFIREKYAKIILEVKEMNKHIHKYNASRIVAKYHKWYKYNLKELHYRRIFGEDIIDEITLKFVTPTKSYILNVFNEPDLYGSNMKGMEQFPEPVPAMMDELFTYALNGCEDLNNFLEELEIMPDVNLVEFDLPHFLL